MKTWNTNKTAALMALLTIAIAFLLLSCEKTEVAQPKQPTFSEVSTNSELPLGNFDIVLDTIPVEEYFTVTSKMASASPDSIWSDTIFRRLQRPLSRWLNDGFYFAENRKDTTIVYLNGTQGVWLSEEWRYWTLED